MRLEEPLMFNTTGCNPSNLSKFQNSTKSKHIYPTSGGPVLAPGIWHFGRSCKSARFSGAYFVLLRHTWFLSILTIFISKFYIILHLIQFIFYKWNRFVTSTRRSLESFSFSSP